MRNLQKYNAVVGSRNITLIDAPTDMTVENIRLIVNETQKVVICSSMQKDNIVSVSGSVITYADTLPVIADGDKFTIECDFGTSEEYQSLEQEVFAGKMSIANAIKLKGGSASNQHSLEVLAQDIATIPDPSGSAENPVVVQMASSSAVAAIAKHYSADTPCAIAFVWLSGDKDEYTVALPSCDKLALSDGTYQENFAGGSVTIAPVEGDLWKYAVCMFGTTNNAQSVAATYASGQKASLYEFAAINMNILTINGFSGTNARIITSNVSVSDVGNNCFQSYYFINIPFKGITQLSGGSAFESCSSLQSVELPSLTTISGSYAFQSCSSLQYVNMPSLTTISGGYSFSSCSSLQSVNMPSLQTISSGPAFKSCSALQSVKLPSLQTIINGSQTFASCSSLQSIELPSLQTISGNSLWLFINCTKLQKLFIPQIEYIYYDRVFQGCTSLNLIEIKQGTDFSLIFSSWNPTEALLTNSTSLVEEGESFTSNREKLLYNIRTYMCAKLKDMTGLTAPTFTFGADLKAAISEDAETLAAFTNKNFNVA